MRTIAVVSGKGGVGKTTATANLGAALALLGRNVCLVDCNLSTPNLGLHFGLYYYAATLGDVLKKKSPLGHALHAHPSGVKLLPASPVAGGLKVTPRAMEGLLEEMEDFEFVLLDCPPGVGGDEVSMVEVADEVLVVTLPEVPAVADAKRAVAWVRKQGTPLLGIEMNRVRGKPFELTLDEVERICDAPAISTVPESIHMLQAVARGNPAVLSYPYDKASLEFRRVGANLFGSSYRPRAMELLLWRVGFGRPKPQRVLPEDEEPERIVVLKRTPKVRITGLPQPRRPPEAPPPPAIGQRHLERWPTSPPEGGRRSGEAEGGVQVGAEPRVEVSTSTGPGAPRGDAPTPEETEKLESNRKKIQALLASIEEYRKKGALSEKTYDEIKTKNEAELSRIQILLKASRNR
ncbi:MAG: P-loop NTPase [Euryarchaeota archaeon]|nr:P-loop NTPase [Euryarchaeota archaeon]